MITIIIGSNRKGNISSVVGEVYKQELLKQYKGEVQIVALEEMPSGILNSDMYTKPNEWIETVKNKSIIPANKFVFILPEYNGTFPGVVKLFIDALSSKGAEVSFHNKKAILVGLSAGKFGNWLGLEHFGIVLNYLKISTFHSKVSITNLWNHFDEKMILTDTKTLEYISKQVKGFLNF